MSALDNLVLTINGMTIQGEHGMVYTPGLEAAKQAIKQLMLELIGDVDADDYISVAKVRQKIEAL